MRFVLVLSASSLALLLAAPVVSGDEPERGALAAGKAGKGKKCKKGQAKVKSGKRVYCVRLPKPKGTVTPRAEDPRLASIKAGLTPAIVGAPDPKDKLPPPMEKVYRSFGPQALKGMEKAVAGSLVKLDAAASRSRLLGSAGWASPSASNGSGYSETIGNLTIDIRLNIAKVATAEFALTRTQSDGRTVAVTYELPFLSSGYDGFHGEPCPNAEGKLKAKDGLGITVRTEVRSNGGKTLDEYLIYKVIDKTDLRAEVGDDAKLDRLEINNIQEVWETVYSSSLYSASQVKGTIVREGTVDMRSGNLNTTINNVEVGVALSGLVRLFSGSATAGIIQRLRKAADEGWEATVKVETDKFRELEKGWNEPNKCAKIVFGKPDRSVTFHRSDTGTETARVDAKPGGSPPKATWELKDQANATITLAGGTANPTNFSYKVLNAGNGAEVKATVKSVSKAGVAEASWIQKTDQSTVNEISGTFTWRTEFAGGVFEAAGNAKFERWTPAVLGPAVGGYKLVSGLYTFTASGKASQIATDKCSMRGSGQFALAKGTEFAILPKSPDGLPPLEYSFSVASEGLSGLPMIEIETFACAPEASEWEGKQTPYPATFFAGTETPFTSADGVTFADSIVHNESGVNFTQTWSFEAKP
jgi:hypothetical protein